MDPLHSHIVLLNDTQFLMSIPNYKVVVQIEFKPKASLICSLKQGALLITKIYAAFFPGSICGGSQQRVSQEQETHWDSWFCIVASPPPPRHPQHRHTLHSHKPSRGQRSMNVFPSEFNSQVNVFLLLKVQKIQYTLLCFPVLLAYRYMTPDIGSLGLCWLYLRERKDNQQMYCSISIIPSILNQI